MPSLANGEVDFILTSPPYFSEDSTDSLSVPLREQVHYDRVVSEVTAYAMGFQANFREMFRVLRDTRFLIVQTRHLRYGNYLVPLADLHCELALNCGFRLVSKVDWLPSKPKPQRIPSFMRSKARFQFKTLDTEVYLILEKGSMNEESEEMTNLFQSPEELIQPLWRTPASGGRHHPYESPPETMRRFIQLFSRPGERVLDPFCGSGTTLVEALKLGRQAIGYEINADYVSVAEGRIS